MEYFPQNYMLTKCLGRENLELFVGSHQRYLRTPDLKQSYLKVFLTPVAKLRINKFDIHNPQIYFQYITDVVQKNPLISENLLCEHQVIQALSHHLLPERKPSSHRPRKSTTGHLYAVGGMDTCKGKLGLNWFSFFINVFVVLLNIIYLFKISVFIQRIHIVWIYRRLIALNCFASRI